MQELFTCFNALALLWLIHLSVASIAQVGTDNVTPLDTLALAVLVLPDARIMSQTNCPVITATAYTGLIPGTVSDLLTAVRLVLNKHFRVSL